jgi:hypothetical protein
MLKVADLQQLVNGLVQPLRSAGASQKVLEDLARLTQGLEPFKDRPMGEFNEFLQKADQCVRTGEWPAPGARGSRRSAGPKAPKVSVEEAAQRIMSLSERAAADQGMDYAAIEAEVQVLKDMTMPQLKEAAEQAHISARGRTKPDLLKAITVAIKERKSSSERTQFRGEGAQQPAATAHPHGTGHGHEQHPRRDEHGAMAGSSTPKP